jgi:predicted aspartyl protease
MIGKLAGLLAFSAVVLVLFEASTWALSLAVAPTRDVPVSDWFSIKALGHGLTDYGNALIWVSAWSTFGMTVGVLLRSTPLALGIGIAWAGPFEHLTQNAWDISSRIYPGLLLESVAVGGTPDAPYADLAGRVRCAGAGCVRGDLQPAGRRRLRMRRAHSGLRRSRPAAAYTFSMRTGIVFPGAEGRQRHVGQIRTTIKLENHSDLERVELGELDRNLVRTVSLDNVLVDTGANHLALPSALIEILGLRPRRDVVVETAAGFRSARIFRGVELTIGPRSGTFDCLELPGGETVLLGVLPLEELGIEIDIQNQRLVVLPDQGPDTYLTAL